MTVPVTSPTAYTVDAMYVSGNFAEVFAPAIANINAPTVAEIAAGIAVECASPDFQPGADRAKGSRRMMCDKQARETLGAKTVTLADQSIMIGNPQDQNAFLTAVTEDSTQYIVTREGMPHDAPFAAGQTVSVYEVKIATIIPGPINDDDNNEFQRILSYAVQRTATDVKVAA